MKIKIALLSLCGLTVMGCSEETNNDDSHDDNTVENYDFTYGVTDDGTVYGDSQNFANIRGNVDSGSQIAAIDPDSNIVHGISEVVEGDFYLSFNMQGLDETQIIISTDDSIQIPSVNNINDLKNAVSLNYVPNESVVNDDGSTTVESETEYEEPEKDEDSQNDSYIASIGDSVEFDSGLIVTVTDTIISDEEPSEAINGKFVRVNFTIDNQMSEPIDFNGHNIELYDGDRNKAELNSKDFYSEEIAPGMKGSGTAYYDAIEEGPYTIMIGAATWKTD